MTRDRPGPFERRETAHQLAQAVIARDLAEADRIANVLLRQHRDLIASGKHPADGIDRMTGKPYRMR